MEEMVSLPGVKGVNGVKTSYLHLLHLICKTSGVNTQIVHINTPNVEGVTTDYSNAEILVLPKY